MSLLTFITDVNSVGLKAAQGLTFVTAFYWDRDDESRAWSKRFFEFHKRMPTMAQAAIYSAIRHYLRAIEAAGTDEAKAVMAKLRDIPVNDFYAKNGKVREDGRMVHDMYFVQVKSRKNPLAPGTTTRSCRPFRAIKLFVHWMKAGAPWSNSDKRLCRYYWCSPSLMKEVITHA